MSNLANFGRGKEFYRFRFEESVRCRAFACEYEQIEILEEESEVNIRKNVRTHRNQHQKGSSSNTAPAAL